MYKGEAAKRGDQYVDRCRLHDLPFTATCQVVTIGLDFIKAS